MSAFGAAAVGKAQVIEGLDPTAEQEAIVDAYNDGGRNIMISALAGTGKTTTLKLIAGQEVSREKLLLVFNKDIQLEIKEKLKGTGTNVQTLNGFGYQLWKKYLQGDITLDQNKGRDLIREAIEKHLTELYRHDYYQALIDTVKRSAIVGSPAQIKYAERIDYTVKKAIKQSIEKTFLNMRLNCFVPDSVDGITRSAMTNETARAMTRDCLTQDISETPDEIIEQFYQIAAETLNRSIDLSLRGIIDFDDQVYMPAVWCDCPGYSTDTLLIDECQDLSTGNLMMLDKVSARIVVAVGDRNQAIYAFRGALSNSMDITKERFDMLEMPLNTCFRCGTSIIGEARRYVPELVSPDWMPEGEVIKGECSINDAVEFIQNGDAVICHINAPLVGMAVQLIKQNRKFSFKKFAGMKATIEFELESVTLKKNGHDDPFEELAAMEKKKVDKLLEKMEPTDSAQDMYECCRVLLGGSQGRVPAAIALLRDISTSTGGITLSSGHSSKGGEWNAVFLLGLQEAETIAETGFRGNRKLSEEELTQFRNLIYVMLTRAQRLLVIVDKKSVEK